MKAFSTSSGKWNRIIEREKKILMLNSYKSDHLIGDKTKNVPVLLSTLDTKNVFSHGENIPSTSQQEQTSTALWYFCTLGFLAIKKQGHFVLIVVFLKSTVSSGCYSLMDFRQPHQFSRLCLVPTSSLSPARNFCPSITPHYNKEGTSCVKNKSHL